MTPTPPAPASSDIELKWSTQAPTQCVTMTSDGTIHVPDGVTAEQVARAFHRRILEIQRETDARIASIAAELEAERETSRLATSAMNMQIQLSASVQAWAEGGCSLEHIPAIEQGKAMWDAAVEAYRASLPTAAAGTSAQP